MKALHRILTAALLLAAVSVGYVGQAQDDAYLTPSKARVARQQAKKAYAREMALERQRQARRDSIRNAQLKARDQATDWYNRRDMRVTVEDMERNLDNLDTPHNGGKYAARMRRFNGEDDGRIVLDDVQKVYVMDDYEYDPWSRSYYGRGWDRNNSVYITINTDPWYAGYRGYGWGGAYSSYYYPWYGGAYGRGYYDPWYAGRWSYPGWYDPWYDPWYSPWGGYYGFGYTWSRPYYRYCPYDYGYYDGGYWGGYYDGWYSRDFSRRYTPGARRTESYYDRHAATYGRALGQGNVSRWSNGGNGVNYTRSNNSRYVNNGRRPTIGTTRANTYSNGGNYSTNRTTSRWNSGSSNSSSSSYSTSRSTYSTPSRSYTPSRSTTTTTTTTTRNNGTGGGRR